MKLPVPAGSEAVLFQPQRRRAFVALAIAAAGHALIALLAIRYGHQRAYFPPGASAPAILQAALIAEVPAPEAAVPLPPLPELAPPLAVAPQQAASEPLPAALPQPSVPAPPTAAAAPSFQERYYRTGEVDQPANPLSEWRIDTARLPPGERHRAALAVWIDSAGKITRVEIARIDPDNDEAREALRDLAQTAMDPATLAGVRVGNVRLIEIVFSRSGR